MEASVVLQYYHLDHKFFFDLHFRRAYVFRFFSFVILLTLILSFLFRFLCFLLKQDSQIVELEDNFLEVIQFNFRLKRYNQKIQFILVFASTVFFFFFHKIYPHFVQRCSK